MTISELQAAYAHAVTGHFVSKLSLADFREFTAYAVEQGAIVCDVEVYELDHGAHVIRTDLGVWPYPHGDLQWREKFHRMDAEITRFLNSLHNENKEFLINVWVDDNS